MDDTDIGRPPRHERPKRKSDLSPAVLLRRGEGPAKRIRGSRSCECGAKVTVDFSGPADSLGARFARAQLDSPRCASCAEEDERREAEQEEMDRRAEALRRRIERSGIPPAWRTVEFVRLDDDAPRREALEMAGAWADGATPGVLLHGPVGRGKTVIAAAAAVERCALGSLRWLSVADLLLDLRMPFNSEEYVRAQRALDPGDRVALVLDDLDKLKPTEHAMQPLYVAVNGWIEAKAPLLVTMNRDLDALAEWGGETFGEAIASRLAGYCDVAEVGGRDRRLS